MELGGDKYRALKWNYVEKEKKNWCVSLTLKQRTKDKNCGSHAKEIEQKPNEKVYLKCLVCIRITKEFG